MFPLKGELEKSPNGNLQVMVKVMKILNVSFLKLDSEDLLHLSVHVYFLWWHSSVFLSIISTFIHHTSSSSVSDIFNVVQFFICPPLFCLHNYIWSLLRRHWAYFHLFKMSLFVCVFFLLEHCCCQSACFFYELEYLLVNVQLVVLFYFNY